MIDTYLVADVGGTQIRAALFPTDDSTPLKIVRTPTQGEGIPPLDRLLDRLASLVRFGDYLSLYLALLAGADPTPIASIDAFKRRLATQGDSPA